MNHVSDTNHVEIEKKEIEFKTKIDGQTCQWCLSAPATLYLLEDHLVQKICSNCSNSYTCKEDRDEFMSDPSREEED